jgi:hypothetical protein
MFAEFRHSADIEIHVAVLDGLSYLQLASVTSISGITTDSFPN